MEKNQRLLRAYVRQILKEDDGGGGGDYGGMSMGSFGSHGYMTLVDGNPLGPVFKPLGNIFKMAGAELKKNKANIKLGINIILGAMKNMVPGMKTNFKDAFSSRSREIKQIESEYKEFYNAAFSPFGENKDLAIATFLWNPALFLTGMLAVKTSKGAKEISIGDFFKKKNESFSRMSLNGLLLEEDDEKKDNVEKGGTKIPDTIVGASKNYRNKFTSGIEKMKEEVTQLKSMSEQDFIKKYAEGLGELDAEYKKASKQFEELKKSGKAGDQQDSPDFKKVFEKVKQNKRLIVNKGKTAIKKLHIKGLQTKKKEFEESLQKLNEKWKLNVSPQKHGLVTQIEEAIEEISKIKI